MHQVPASVMDEDLLADILNLFTSIIKESEGIDQRLAQWFLHVLDQPKGALMIILNRPEAPADVGDNIFGTTLQSMR